MLDQPERDAVAAGHVVGRRERDLRAAAVERVRELAQRAASRGREVGARRVRGLRDVGAAAAAASRWARMPRRRPRRIHRTRLLGSLLRRRRAARSAVGIGRRGIETERTPSGARFFPQATRSRHADALAAVSPATARVAVEQAGGGQQVLRRVDVEERLRVVELEHPRLAARRPPPSATAAGRARSAAASGA